MEEDRNKGYWFVVGSLAFRNFKDLYDNIKGRTSDFDKFCAVAKDGKVLFSFGLKYQALPKGLGSSPIFTLEFDESVMKAFKGDLELKKSLGSYLPKFHRVGSTAQGHVPKQKLYGQIDIGKLR